MKSNKINAIVLRRTNYGEADRILQLLTPNGKISVMAKGVRKEKSRLAGGIELFSICEVSVSEGRGDLGVLTSARLIIFFENIIKNYDRMQFAYQVIKLISEISEGSDSTECYDVLAETLAGLNSESVDEQLIEAWFYIRYADLTGYGLSLYNDIDDKKIVEGQKYQYDVSERGLKLSPSGVLSSEHIKLLRLIASKSIKILAQIGGIQSIIKDCAYVAREHAAV
jgi:DNA repair protein RecO (recombination protein O)